MYDAIVIGAGNGGLMAALTLQKSGKKVLLLDSNFYPGGLATSFVRGRFEFEATLQELYDFGSLENHGSLYELFERFSLTDKIEFLPLKESFHLIFNESKEEYIMPFGISNYIEKLEQYVPGSASSVKRFFSLADESFQALSYLNETHWKPDEEILSRDYASFLDVCQKSVKEVFDQLQIPLKAQEILGAFWITFGSPLHQLSFFTYAKNLSSYLNYGGWIPKLRSHEMSLTIQEEFEFLGGTTLFLTTVKQLLFQDGKVHGVECLDGSKFYSSHIVSNVSPHMLYGKLLPNEMQTKEMSHLCQSREFGGKAFCVYLGLNRSVEELGLAHYKTYIYETFSSETEFERMKTLEFSNCIATVLNQVNPDCSPSGTTLLTLTSYHFGNAFSNVVHSENYYSFKEKIASDMISFFENAMNLSIRDAIEEIEIATPSTFAYYTGHPDGTIFGYFAKKQDDLLERLACFKEEEYISNVHFCGGFGERLHGYGSSYLSGANAAMQTIEDMNKKGNGNEE